MDFDFTERDLHLVKGGSALLVLGLSFLGMVLLFALDSGNGQAEPGLVLFVFGVILLGVLFVSFVINMFHVVKLWKFGFGREILEIGEYVSSIGAVVSCAGLFVAMHFYSYNRSEWGFTVVVVSFFGVLGFVGAQFVFAEYRALKEFVNRHKY